MESQEFNHNHITLKHIHTMNRKTKKQTTADAKAKAAQKAKEKALKEEAKTFFKNDYPKILKAQRIFEYPCAKELLEWHEGGAFENFIVSTHSEGKWDNADLLSELESMLSNKYPEAYASWVKDLKETAIRLGYCKWAKKHIKEAADLF